MYKIAKMNKNIKMKIIQKWKIEKNTQLILFNHE